MMRILLLLPLLTAALAAAAPPREFNVREFGAAGDGTTLDTAAINRAILAAEAAGGGTVCFSPGTYLSGSIRLRSNLTVVLEQGATLLAATPAPGFGAYDPPEPNAWGDKFQYQDFGHSHWHNSLIWGEDLDNVAILGPGLINGKGLVRNAGYGGGRGGATGPNGTAAPGAPGSPPAVLDANGAPAAAGPPRPSGNVIGAGDKAIGLKNCRHVMLRDFSVLLGGHFAVLVTGVDHLTLDHLTIDTNRDGFDIDACRDVTVSRCVVNAPKDDAIVLKSSYALGSFRDTEDVAITQCTVTGYDEGTVLDGTRQRTMDRAPDRDGPTGRIKIGTESSGGFRRVTIADCTFERSRGLALETVDGGVIEDITVRDLVMRDLASSPIFIRLGNRGRSPAGTPVGAIRRVTISRVTVTNADARYPSIIAGLPGHPVEGVVLRDISLQYRGGLTLEQVAAQPTELVNPFFLRGREPGLTGPRDPVAPPEQAVGYPEPSMFGLLPAYGLFIRHAQDITVENVTVGYAAEDRRPPVVLQDVAGISFRKFNAQRAAGVPGFVLKDVTNFTVQDSPGTADTTRAAVAAGSF